MSEPSSWAWDGASEAVRCWPYGLSISWRVTWGFAKTFVQMKVVGATAYKYVEIFNAILAKLSVSVQVQGKLMEVESECGELRVTDLSSKLSTI